MRTAKRIFILLFIAGIFLVFAGNRTLYFKTGIFEKVSSVVVYPFLVFHKKITAPITAFFVKSPTIKELEAQIKELSQERETLLADTIRLNASLNYVDATKELRMFAERYESENVLIAQILVKHLNDNGHYFLVDAGSKKGIEQDMVAVYKNCLLGRVIQVYPLYSKVVLITDQSCKVAAVCTQTKASGIHEGTTQEKRTALKFVSHLSNLTTNDLILSSGEGLVFPQGFGLGKIAHFEPDGLHYRVEVEPLVDFGSLSYCCLIGKDA